LQYQGALVTAGQFGTIAPIGAEQTASGYDLAWKIPGTNQYEVWTTDSNGNFLANITGLVSGNSIALESLETTFHQDLNNDGTIGVTGSVIESFGSTSLLQVGSNYYFKNISSGTGVELQYQGAPVTAGQFSAVPIGAEQTASGYDLAWKISGTNQYEVWTTDNNGNFLANITGLVSGNSTALESLETTFHQDLNGDGTIGIPSVTIEAFGSTSLVEVGSNYYLDNISSGTGPELKYQGAPVTANQFGTIAPIAAEQTASGYDVAWKIPGTNQYEVWTTDSNGNFLANITGLVSGNSIALESLEPTFHQDLNGDGTIGIPPTSAQSGSAMMVEAGNDNFVFRADLGAAPPVTTADKSGWHAPPPSAGDTNITWPHNDAQHDHWQAVQPALDGPDADHHHAAAANFHVADMHASHFIIQ
jgi:serralysin